MVEQRYVHELRPVRRRRNTCRTSLQEGGEATLCALPKRERQATPPRMDSRMALSSSCSTTLSSGCPRRTLKPCPQLRIAVESGCLAFVLAVHAGADVVGEVRDVCEGIRCNLGGDHLFRMMVPDLLDDALHRGSIGPDGIPHEIRAKPRMGSLAREPPDDHLANVVQQRTVNQLQLCFTLPKALPFPVEVFIPTPPNSPKRKSMCANLLRGCGPSTF